MNPCMSKLDKKTQKLLERAFVQSAESARAWFVQTMPRETSHVQDFIFDSFVETNLAIFMASVAASGQLPPSKGSRHTRL